MKGRKVAEDSVIERCISVEATDVGHQLIICYGKMCCFYHNCQNSSVAITQHAVLSYNVPQEMHV